MPHEIVFYITKYGYLAIFILVILQESGMPNPMPNELLLMFSGYLSSRGILSLPLLIMTVAAADFIASNILYLLFFRAGSFIIQKKPKWIPLSARTLDRMAAKIASGGNLSFYFFRLTPFTRGYTSVIAGLLRVRPKVYLPVILITSSAWATVYIIAGRLIGPSWDQISQNFSTYKSYMLIVAAFISGIVLLILLFRKRVKSRKKIGMNIS